MIAGIEVTCLWHGRSGEDPTWFHPRPCVFPYGEGVRALMTLQRITGSDVFHQVHWTVSDDPGGTWTTPEPIPSLGRIRTPDGLDNGVCDVVPQYLPRTGTILVLGHNVWYKDDRLAKPSTDRYPVYVLHPTDGGPWSPRKKLEWDDPRGSAMYTCGCGQRVLTDSGDVVVPLSFGPEGREDRAAGSLLCSFDGKTLAVEKATRKELRLPVGRGLLEPSITCLQKRFYMTLRAEDGHGYVATSDDGVQWHDMQPWAWDDGAPLAMSTTQQHWATHNNALFLVYTRKAENNTQVMRWRSPVFVAEVDLATLRLQRDSERIVLPLIGDGIRDGRHVARMGNFHVVDASPKETWVTVGECLPEDGWRGDTLLARIRWKTPSA